MLQLCVVINDNHNILSVETLYTHMYISISLYLCLCVNNNSNNDINKNIRQSLWANGFVIGLGRWILLFHIYFKHIEFSTLPYQKFCSWQNEVSLVLGFFLFLFLKLQLRRVVEVFDDSFDWLQKSCSKWELFFF